MEDGGKREEEITNCGASEITNGREPQKEQFPASQLLRCVLGLELLILVWLGRKEDGGRVAPRAQPRVEDRKEA